VLARYGAWYLTASKTAQYSSLISKIKANVKQFSGDYAFLASYSYTLGADQLTLFGENEMIESGSTFYYRYRSLAATSTPFFRSSGEDRIVRSAQNFTQGFHQAKVASTRIAGDGYPYPILVYKPHP
jgi:Histidine phosphatase superfamily (branch 2)